MFNDLRHVKFSCRMWKTANGLLYNDGHQLEQFFFIWFICATAAAASCSRRAGGNHLEKRPFPHPRSFWKYFQYIFYNANDIYTHDVATSRRVVVTPRSQQHYKNQINLQKKKKLSTRVVFIASDQSEIDKSKH